MIGSTPPRILDASALLDVFAGNREIMQMLDDVDEDQLAAVVPTLALAEAQAALASSRSHWEWIMGLRSLRSLPVTDDVAFAIGDIAAPRIRYHPVHTALIGPLMIAQVLYEAKLMNAVIMTRVPEAYGGHEVSIHTLE
ncbi:hypothetical protein [Actinoplanes derwentensis]|uniref:PIN domain-containing protein n=1 Tax=Actinoplanes derwentensis TaxID=113562 RepID=A0A1H1WI34_9ACTN|nr:hypothetical protein [Actinoplanes derwentensis]GID87448.1 hypothetical protein Ade03nite_63720 [Actinoplanes derwentensis]SDS96947.1 hypothetical protein SAMN04489716_2120 [Actinoplanes derwentensis]